MLDYAQQEKYRALYRKINPSWHDGIWHYEQLFKKYLQPNLSILDAGCGKGGIIRKYKDKIKLAIGVDLDKKATENPNLNKIVQANLDNLPFGQATFDIILCSWVFEHLSNPEKVFSEFARVIKPGGHVLFITPNKWNYLVILNRLFPKKFQKKIIKRIYNREEKDVFPVQYKVNSKRSIENLFKKHGFVKEELLFIGDPTYIAFSRRWFKIGVALEKVIDQLFPFTKVHLVGSFRKI